MTTLGRWLEATGRLKADLGARRPGQAAAGHRPPLGPGTAAEELVPLEQIWSGDRLRVLPGRAVPRRRTRGPEPGAWSTSRC